MSLINHDGESLGFGNSVGDVFYTNTGIWWHCDDENITQICDFTKRGLCHKKTTTTNKLMAGSTDILFVVYIRKIHLITCSSKDIQIFDYFLHIMIDFGYVGEFMKKKSYMLSDGFS